MITSPLNDKKIVAIGGGTGVFTVLSGLKNRCKNLTAIVTMADDGGSTGLLREEFGILPTGDVRRALIALSRSDNKLLAELFNYRFTEGKGLAGHAFGNLLLTALERLTGSFELAIKEAGKILAAGGEVIPVTTANTRLIAELEDGTIIRGERNIDIPRHDGQLRIKKISLEPRAKINPRAARAILQADFVLIGPGDLYTSIIPNLLVEGIQKALLKTKARVIYFVNCMTKFGETNGMRASDFLGAVLNYLGREIIDYVAINKTRPAAGRLKPYTAERASFAEADLENFDSKPVPLVADLIRSKGLIRHDSEKIAKLLELIG